MRRSIAIILSVAALAAAAALFTSPSPAGGQTEGDEFATFEIIKDVHGDGPLSGFVITYTCVDRMGAVQQTETLNFDNLDSTQHETQVVSIDGPYTCTIDETNSNGADLVEYECEYFAAPPAGIDEPTAGDTEGLEPGSCVSDRSAEINRLGDFASFLVRNTFDPEVIPDEEEPPPPTPAAQPDVVTATPPFTG